MRRAQARAAALAAVLTVMVAGCGLIDFKYEEADIQDVVKGIVPTTSDRYRIALPVIPVVRKNIGIVRQEGLFVPIVGPDLKATLARYAGRDIEIGVHFRREPRRHLVLERLWIGDEEIRLVESGQDFRYRLPNFVDASDIAFDRFDQEFGLCEVGPHEQTRLASAEHKNLYISEFRVKKAEIPEAIAGTELVRASGRSTSRAQYFLTSAGSDYLVSSRDPMIYLMLDYLLTENREFKGGIVVQGIFDRETRVATRIAGTADIKWIALGGPLYFRPS